MSKNTIVGIVVVVLLLGGYLLLKSFWLTSTSPVVGGLAGLKQQPGYLPGHGLPEGLLIPDSNTVVLSDSGYSPAMLIVKKGEYVVFKNESTQSMWTASAMHPTHTAYSGTSLSEHCPDVAGTSFDECKGDLPGESWSFKFDKVGTWKYHNHLNTSGWGTIVVQ